MKFHDELNPKIWTKMTEKRIGGKINYYLKPEVRHKLNEISDAFIEYLDIPQEAILDIRITGSSANYNYTPHSDLDLHVIVDYDKVHEDCPIVEGYLWSMKSAFNKDHDISIYGIPVELYAEDSRVEAISNGVYSLLNNKWLKIPEKIKPTSNDAAVEAKFNELAEAIDKCDDSEVAKELQDKIYQMRKTGLSQEGEFSTENLAFKKLRDIGALDKLRELKKAKIDKELTLESYNESDHDLTNFCIIIDGDYNWLEEYGTFKSCKAAQEWLDKNGEEGWMYSQLTKGEMKDLGIDEYGGYVNESINESEDKLDYEQFKITKSNFGPYFVTPYDSRIGRIEGSSAATVRNKLAAAINKYNSKSITAERKALINKLHKLFKQAGIPKMKDMKSSIRGYRPITQNGYYIEIYKGDYTTFNIGITGNREELGNKIKEILNNEGVKYTGGVDYFTVDMEKQDNKNESIKEYYEEDDTDSSEEMHKTDYVIYFKTMEGQTKKLLLSIITDEYDPSYNEVINTASDRQLGLFDTLKQAKDFIKSTAEKCARNTGYTIISIDNLGYDDEYYLKRNNYESLNNWDTSKLSIKELNLKVEKLLENFN